MGIVHKVKISKQAHDWVLVINLMETLRGIIFTHYDGFEVIFVFLVAGICFVPWLKNKNKISPPRN